MNIPILTRWLKSRKNRQEIEEFLKLQQRKAKILAIKRQVQK